MVSRASLQVQDRASQAGFRGVKGAPGVMGYHLLCARQDWLQVYDPWAMSSSVGENEERGFRVRDTQLHTSAVHTTSTDTYPEDVMMIEPGQPPVGPFSKRDEFILVLRGIEAVEGRPLEELLKTDMDRLVPIIGEALLEKFPELNR